MLAGLRIIGADSVDLGNHGRPDSAGDARQKARAPQRQSSQPATNHASTVGTAPLQRMTHHVLSAGCLDAPHT